MPELDTDCINIAERIFSFGRDHPRKLAVIDAAGPATYGDLLDSVEECRQQIERRELPALVAFAALGDRTSIVRLLAILASGRAYVPLNPREPRARHDEILGLSGAAFLGTEYVETRMSPAPGLPTNTAYVLATSGSTGRPKLVPITHQNAESFITWVQEFVGVDHEAVIGNISPLSFDLSIFDVFVGLGWGGTLIQPAAGPLAIGSALRAFQSAKATHIYAVPTAWQLMHREAVRAGIALDSVRHVMLAGEPLTPDLYRRLREWLPSANLYNLYGPVETNVVSAMKLDSSIADSIPIGRPVSGATLVLGRDLDPISRRGVPDGELLVAGPSVFHGYLGESDATPFILDGQRAWYRTRDIVRRDVEGVFYFQERDGRSFKRHGYLVDPSEIESAARTSPSVSCAHAFMGRHAAADHDVLILLLVSQAENALSEVRDAVRKLLPSYMWPDEVFAIKEAPLTGTGKVDRRALEAFWTS